MNSKKFTEFDMEKYKFWLENKETWKLNFSGFLGF